MENTKKKQRRPARGVTAGGAIFALESEVALAGDPAVPVAYTPQPCSHACPFTAQCSLALCLLAVRAPPGCAPAAACQGCRATAGLQPTGRA
jgi:hypothetical protein